ncbi:hypothetical protein GMMP15_510010 [Candidatus Magnetomoraceae bacterium gMMP-15]
MIYILACMLLLINIKENGYKFFNNKIKKEIYHDEEIQRPRLHTC